MIERPRDATTRPSSGTACQLGPGAPAGPEHGIRTIAEILRTILTPSQRLAHPLCPVSGESAGGHCPVPRAGA